MTYDEIEQLRERHPAWALVRAQNVAFVLSFLSRVFVDGGESNVAASRLIRELDDELYALDQRLGDGAYPRSAKEYLDDWSNPSRSWLRRYYPPGADEPHYDLTVIGGLASETPVCRPPLRPVRRAALRAVGGWRGPSGGRRCAWNG